jgi:hypothetical protein
MRQGPHVVESLAHCPSAVAAGRAAAEVELDGARFL